MAAPVPRPVPVPVPLPVGVIAMEKAKAVASACRFSETHLVNGYNKFFYKLKLVISIVLALLCVVVKDVLSPLPPFAGLCLSVHSSYALLWDAQPVMMAAPAAKLYLALLHHIRLRVWDQDLEVPLESNSKTTFNYVKHFGSVAHIHTHSHTHTHTHTQKYVYRVGVYTLHTCVSSSKI